MGVFVESLQQTESKTIIKMKEIIIRYFMLSISFKSKNGTFSAFMILFEKRTHFNYIILNPA